MAELHVPILVNWDDIKDHLAKSDIVEVIRCRDCKYATDDDQNATRFWCSYKWPANMVPGNGYCFRGERNEDRSD